MTVTNDFLVETSEHLIIIERLFDAPRDLLFGAWTSAEHVVHWWGPNGFTTTVQEMDVRPGGVWRYIMHGPDGVDYDNEIVYREIVEPERLVYTHGSGDENDPGQFHVTVTFAEQDGQTRLTMRMLFASAAQRDEAVGFGAVEGGNQTLGRLEEYLPKMDKERNHSDGPSADPEFVISRVFDAPRELVFKAWTDPDHMLQWWGPKGFTATAREMDVRPGGTFHYRLQSPGGQEMWGKFVYREIVPPERLVYVNSFSDEQGNITRAPFSDVWPLELLNQLTLTERDGRTTLTLRARAINATTEEQARFEAEFKSMEHGFAGTFNQLDQHLAEMQGA